MTRLKKATWNVKKMTDKLYGNFIKTEPVNKGWSDDKKYRVTAADGTEYLLRISPASMYEKRKDLFAMMERTAALGIPMCNPVEFGVCDEGVYSVLSWINGDDLEDMLPLLPETGQYALGLQSGEIIRKMHAMPAPETQEDWEIRFNRKTDNKIKKYRECGVRFEGDAHVINYLENNRHLLKNRPQCFQHGDYHTGNMMLENGRLKIIDFDRFDYGDPWEEFNRIVWSAAASPHFATGQLRGYFGGEPPFEFFRLLTFYIASNTLSSVYWAISFGPAESETMMKQTQDVLRWFDNMNNPVPSWYLKNFYIQWIDGIPYKLKSPFGFSFIKKYGRVFKIFDDQDSGNICLGAEKNGKKYFIKFAGAPAERATVSAAEAVANLERTVAVYRDLAHPNLVKLVEAERIGGGFAMIFEWAEAECMHRMYPLSRKKFLQMPLETRLRLFGDILGFFLNVAKQGYVAIDFYDGSIMYDFNAGKTLICDIDLFEKKPYVNNMGRLWGSSRFMSPEEFRKGAVIDEVTNVYTMGATAFALFGGEEDRSPEKWLTGKKLFDVAAKAVSDERKDRQQTIEQFVNEWKAAL